ncbi:hypothetical protein PENTCL1PPCAC_13009, partial [Pristionchus entomophagus]
MEETYSFLGRLPKEIRWMILDFVPDSIAEIKLVSRSARMLIEEWAQLHSVEYHRVKAKKENDHCINIVIDIEKSKAACYPHLRIFSQDPNVTSLKETTTDYEGCIAISSNLPYENFDFELLEPVLR